MKVSRTLYHEEKNMKQRKVPDHLTEDGLSAFSKVKFEIYGLEMKEKQVKANK